MKRILSNEEVVQVLEENILKIDSAPPETLVPIFLFISKQNGTAKQLKELAVDSIRVAENEDEIKTKEDLLHELEELKERFG